MPMYEYKCVKCDCVFDKIVKDKNERVFCLKCGGPAVINKLFYKTPTIFKCGGFYETDYKKKGK